MSDKDFTPTHLGKQSQKAVEKLDLIPWESKLHEDVKVTLNATEFTSHCPVTKQPDFANLVFEYVPKKSLVETKSFKLWLWRYRDVAQFNEKIVQEMADEFYKQVRPENLTITGNFNIRGGISVQCKVTRGHQ